MPATHGPFALTLFDPPASASTTVNSVSPAGSMTGYFDDGTGVLHGFVRTADETAPSVPPAVKPVATTKSQCDGQGWKTVYRTNGSPFKNQGDCIQYVNTGK